MENNKGYFNIFYNNKSNFVEVNTKKIGDPIYFYVDEPNYQIIPDEWKSEISLVPPFKAYIKNNGKYEEVDQYYYQNHQYQTYYWINGTGEKDCPACSGDGLILGDDNIEYTCPRCKGIGHLYFLTEPVPIKGIIANLRKTKLNNNEDNNETLIIKYIATTPGTYVNRTLTEDELISEEEINEYLEEQRE